MNLAKLFEQQKILRDRIAYNESDRFDKLILALLVEIGECANEWRGFKFWSKDQDPRIKVAVECPSCEGEGLVDSLYGHKDEACMTCNGSGRVDDENPLLIEYVDGLHFVLELGIELEIDIDLLDLEADKAKSIDQQFIDIHYLTTNLHENQRFYAYEMLFSAYLDLGEMLVFTWEQIEQAYYSKNQINHKRQDEGY